MKKSFLTIVFLFVFGFGNSQELMNFYLSPNIPSSETPFSTEETTLLLHTTFYAFTGAGFNDYYYTIEDNVINFKLCYGVGSTAVTTLDKMTFEIVMPSFIGDYTFNIELYTDYNGTTCGYEDITYSSSVDFSFPYYPTEKVEITDPAFESYLEYLDYGDDEFDNGFVYTHKIENLTSLYFTSSDFEMDGIIESLFSIKHFEALKNLNVNNQSLTSLNLEYNIELERLFCELNTLESLDLSNNYNLKYLYRGVVNFNGLDVSNNTLLEALSFSSDVMDTIDLSTNSNLKELYFLAEQISSLDLSNNLLLERIMVGNTSITTLDLSNNNLLYYLVIVQNEFLTELNLSTLINIRTMYCSGNMIEGLDLSLNQNLATVHLNYNNLNYLNIKNGNNEDIYEIKTYLNPNLYCIEVDSVDGPQPFGYSIDPQTEFSEDCSVPEPIPYSDKKNSSQIASNFHLYPNPTQHTIFIETQGQFVETIKIINLQGSVIKQVEKTSQVDVSNLASGMYFMEIYSEGNRITKKFIKL